jgi:arylsulfatase
MRNFSSPSALFWLVLCLFGHACDVESADRPNVVLIFTDDQGYGDVGCFGAKDVRTPCLDRLAAEGRRFTNFYVAQAVCTASRSALMSGCYANRVSLFGALNHQSREGIAPDELLLPEMFKSQGYATAAFGKWHLGTLPEFSPLRNGFDEFFGIPYSNDNGPLHGSVRTLPSLPLLEGEKTVELDPDQSQFTRRFTDRAIAFMEKYREQPFFLYVPHVMPHVPIFASEKFKGRSSRGLYGDVIEELDAGIGELVAAVDRFGLKERTLVIFATDNGPFLSYGNHGGSAGPLREGKLTTFEGGVRTPCLMRMPGTVPAGSTCDEVIAAIDLLPTLAKWIGAPLSSNKIDGLDVAPLIRGDAAAKTPHEAIYFYSGDELQAVRSGKWKLHVPHPYLTSASPPGRDGRPANFENMQKLPMNVSGIQGIASRHGYVVKDLPLSLFDLNADPGEMQNVAEANPEVVQRLLGLIELARADLGDSLTKRTGSGVRPCGKF